MLLTIHCILLTLLFLPLCAQGSKDSQSAVGYEVRNSEAPTEQTNKVQYGKKITHNSLLLQCKPVEGDSVPRPTTAVTMDEKFSIFSGKRADWLPPDPGAAGKRTIVGVDSDGDCVRDDIERYIVLELLPSSSQKKTRKYLYEYAKWRGQFLKYSNLSTETAKEISRNLSEAGECVRRTLNNDLKAHELIDKVFAQFHNTFPRSYRYIDNLSLLGGWTTRETFTIKCP